MIHILKKDRTRFKDEVKAGRVDLTSLQSRTYKCGDKRKRNKRHQKGNWGKNRKLQRRRAS